MYLCLCNTSGPLLGHRNGYTIPNLRSQRWCFSVFLHLIRQYSNLCLAERWEWWPSTRSILTWNNWKYQRKYGSDSLFFSHMSLSTTPIQGGHGAWLPQTVAIPIENNCPRKFPHMNQVPSPKPCSRPTPSGIILDILYAVYQWVLWIVVQL